MTIVDQQHAAQAVTDKGKIYVFDAIECMVHFSRDNSEQQYAHLLVNHYTNPKALHAAESSTFLISEALPSPMGAYLNALPDAAKAEELSSELGGEVYNWNELMSELD